MSAARSAAVAPSGSSRLEPSGSMTVTGIHRGYRGHPRRLEPVTFRSMRDEPSFVLGEGPQALAGHGRRGGGRPDRQRGQPSGPKAVPEAAGVGPKVGRYGLLARTPSASSSTPPAVRNMFVRPKKLVGDWPLDQTRVDARLTQQWRDAGARTAGTWAPTPCGSVRGRSTWWWRRATATAPRRCWDTWSAPPAARWSSRIPADSSRCVRRARPRPNAAQPGNAKISSPGPRPMIVERRRWRRCL